MAVKLVLDTNAYCLCDVGHNEAIDRVASAAQLFLPVIVYGELYYGFRCGNRFQWNHRRLEAFLKEFDVALIAVDAEVAQKFADIFAGLRAKGRPIPTNDIWISACCMSVGGTLLTADHHFSSVEQIQVVLLEQV